MSHIRKIAAKKGVDLLLVDSGDLHDGSGLSDGFPPDQIDGSVSNKFHSKIEYDLLTIGNHELYKYSIAYDTYTNFVPAQQKGRYISSNVNISIYDEQQGKNISRPIGDRFVKFNTTQGKRVTSLGVLFKFTGQDGGITIQDAKLMVKEDWFAQAIAEEPDVFLLAGHMPVARDEWPVVVNAIREVHPKTPIILLGGHTHVRDCITYDGQSVGLESGRYLETIGWISANLSSAQNGNLSFSRTYIDANRRNYAYHLGLSQSKLDTPQGVNITNAMKLVADAWNLTRVYGKAPQDYYLDREDMSSNSSLLNLLQNEVLTTVISPSNPDRQGTPNIILLNSGAQRFDIYAGNFTRNDQYIVSPFTNAFIYIKDVPWRYAQQVLGRLNRSGTRRRSDLEESGADEEAYARGEVDDVYRSWRSEQVQLATSRYYEDDDLTQAQKDLLDLDRRADAASEKTLGYVTSDGCSASVGNGPLGDDTEHSPIPYSGSPAYIQSPVFGNTTALEDSTGIDVIFVDFFQSTVLSILNSLQSEKNYTQEDVEVYNTLSTQDLYPLYAAKKWQ